MLQIVKVIQRARKDGTPAIKKWEGFERSALPIIFGSLAMIETLFLTNCFNGLLILVGGLTALGISTAYYFMLSFNIVASAVVSVLVALTAPTAVALYASYPLWVVMLNGLGGTLFVIGTIAFCTKRI